MRFIHFDKKNVYDRNEKLLFIKETGTMKVDVRKLPHSEIEITAEIPADIFESFRSRAVVSLQKNFEMPGFRKGHVPENILLEKIPEMSILEEMAEMAINDTYPKIIEENKLDPIGRPAISITKIAKGNPLGFTVHTAMVPEVKLPDYKTIAAKTMAEKIEIVVTDEEMEKTIEEIIKSRLPKFSQSENFDKETVLAELTDDFVKTLGDFQNVSEFREKLKENIKLEKERAEKEKRRIELLGALAEKSEIDLPTIIIEEEKNKLLSQLRYDVERLGLEFDDYLKKLNKTEDDIKKEWESEAVKRAKIQFIITEIGAKENISPTKEELDREVKHLLENDRGLTTPSKARQAGVDESRARLYLTSLITNQKVIEFLEKQEA